MLRYQTLTVADLQELRTRPFREAGVTIKVVKNRLVRVALQEIDTYKETDTGFLVGQLVYAVSG
ncbi:50S ribosomal protein L10 [Candidatus Minimicrobia naudis]